MRDFWRALRRNRLALFGGVIVACLATLAIAAPLIAPWDPNRPDVKKILNPPSQRHVFGTDQLGRDVLSRMLYGARVSRSEEHTSELQSLRHLVCRLLLEKEKRFHWYHR